MVEYKKCKEEAETALNTYNLRQPEQYSARIQAEHAEIEEKGCNSFVH